MEKLIPLQREHLPHLIENLREWDRQELQSFRDLTVEDALTELLDVGSSVWVSPKGNPCVVCGLVPHSTEAGVGVPFLLATDEFYEHTRLFARESKLWVEEARKQYPLLYNLVAADNTVAVRWLKWLGFFFGEPIENLGRYGLTFYPFYLRSQ